MSAASHVPLALKDKSIDSLLKQFAKLQARQGARLKVLSVYFDTSEKQHILIYYPYRNLGGSLF